MEEIARRIKSGQVPGDDTIVKDDQFLADLDQEAAALLGKERERAKLAKEAAEIEAQVLKDRVTADEKGHQLRIKECDIKYQQAQH